MTVRRTLLDAQTKYQDCPDSSTSVTHSYLNSTVLEILASPTRVHLVGGVEKLAKEGTVYLKEYTVDMIPRIENLEAYVCNQAW